jgi:hypothetical protein
VQQGQLNIGDMTGQSPANIRSKWNLQPDKRVVKANCATLISLRAFADTVVPELAAIGCQIGVDFSLPGDANVLSKFFSIHFLGALDAAVTNSNRLLDSLRTAPGKWRQLFAATPAGSTIQLYLGPDKSIKQQALEVTTKRFAAILATQMSSVSADLLYSMRSEGLVFHNFQPLALIGVQEGGICNISWNPLVATELGLNQGDILQTLTAETRAAAEGGKGGAALRARASQVQWSP